MLLALKQLGNVGTAIVASGSEANRVPGLKQQAPFDLWYRTCARLEYEHVAVEAHSHEKGGARFQLCGFDRNARNA